MVDEMNIEDSQPDSFEDLAREVAQGELGTQNAHLLVFLNQYAYPEDQRELLDTLVERIKAAQEAIDDSKYQPQTGEPAITLEILVSQYLKAIDYGYNIHNAKAQEMGLINYGITDFDVDDNYGNFLITGLYGRTGVGTAEFSLELRPTGDSFETVKFDSLSDM